MPRVDVLEAYVSAELVKERNSVADEDGDPRDYETLNEAGTEEPLDRYATVNI